MRPAQRGAALLALVAALSLGISWMLVSALNAASLNPARQTEHNARVLAEAKTALIAWLATTALDATENNPGRLPCPQAWADVGTANEGRAAGNCAATAVGWLPWRSLGLPVLYDADGRQLWYIVSPGWHISGAGNLYINSNSDGQLNLDGSMVVALVIAAGAPLNIAPTAAQAAAGCTARNQRQALSLPATPPSPLDFLECQNGTTVDNVFTSAVVGNQTNRVFNDQVLAITAADIMPVLEAAIAKRIERDIVPLLRDVYLGENWGFTAGTRVFPYAATFANPGPGAGTSNYAGSAGTYQGLLPFNQVNCAAAAGNPRCLPGAALVTWAGAASAYDGGGVGFIRAGSQTCSWEAGNAARVCQGEYQEEAANPGGPGMRIEMQVTLNNVAMGLRMLDTTRMQVEAKDDTSAGPWLSITPGSAVTMNADGSVTIRFWGDLPNIDSQGWGTYADYRIRIERLVMNDHSLLDSNAATGWLVRNDWFRLLYYATAQAHTAEALPGAPACATDTNCLRLTTWPNTAPAWDKRALLVLAGNALANQDRGGNPAALTNYLEFQNNDGGTLYEQQVRRTVVNANPALKSPFNDRVVVLDSN